jgi:hypothetical protein
MAAQGMLLGRTRQFNFDETLPPSDNLRYYGGVNYFGLDSNVSLAQAKSAVDGAVTNKNIVSFIGHKFDAAAGINQWATTDFQALVDYVVASGLPCLTNNDFYQLQSGPVDIPVII